VKPLSPISKVHSLPQRHSGAGERIAEELHVIERDRHDDGGQRRRDHVGGVEFAAKAGLQQQDVGLHAREDEEGGDRRDLEEGDRIAAIGALAFFDQIDQRLLFDQRAGDADALMEAHQVRRGIDMHALTRRLQHGAQVGDDRTLAVGAGDMHHRRQLSFGISDQTQQTFDARELQVDDLRMEPHHALQHDVAGVGHAVLSPITLSSWSDLVRPSTSFQGQYSIAAGKLVDGRAKHDHDGGVETVRTSVKQPLASAASSGGR
jgi:hypothetical protein